MDISKISSALYFSKILPRMLPLFLNSLTVQKDGSLVVVTSYKSVYFLILSLKKNLIIKSSSLMDIWGVDFPYLDKRFQINYLLLNYLNMFRIRIVTYVSEMDILESVSSIYPSASWLEREVWDMYGVFFQNHKDLRRILTDYGFKGHPLRKDFPLTGYTEVRYSEKRKRVIVKPIQIAQEFRLFDFSTPWEKFDN
jgi:NADH dehydrogenase (ubiquinone) Fe-S protein 3